MRKLKYDSVSSPTNGGATWTLPTAEARWENLKRACVYNTSTGGAGTAWTVVVSSYTTKD